MRFTVICVAGHRRTFRGPLKDFRFRRWYRRHYHPEYLAKRGY